MGERPGQRLRESRHERQPAGRARYSWTGSLADVTGVTASLPKERGKFN